MTDCAICGSSGTEVTAIVCQDCKEAVLLMKDIMSNLVADGGFTPEEIPLPLIRRFARSRRRHNPA